MAIIDLRHLVDPEFETIVITGNEDKKDYRIPLKKNIGITLMMSQYFQDYNKTVSPDTPDYMRNVELNYRMVASWIRGFYPELSIEWVKKNISDDLLVELVNLLEPVFFPKMKEAPKPIKKGKNRRS